MYVKYHVHPRSVSLPSCLYIYICPPPSFPPFPSNPQTRTHVRTAEFPTLSLQREDYAEAASLAFELRQPRRLLGVLSAALDRDCAAPGSASPVLLDLVATFTAEQLKTVRIPPPSSPPPALSVQSCSHPPPLLAFSCCSFSFRRKTCFRRHPPKVTDVKPHSAYDVPTMLIPRVHAAADNTLILTKICSEANPTHTRHVKGFAWSWL